MNLPSLLDRDGALRWQLWRVLPLTAVLGLATGPAGEPAADGSTRAPKPRMLSPHLKAAIRISLPTYAPPTSPDANAPVAVDAANVVVLDPMIVTDERPLVVAEWDMLTDLGRADYLKKRYKGATMPGAALTESTPNYATLMHREEVRLQRLKELDDITKDLRLTMDHAGTRKLNKEIQRAQFRRSDALTEAMDKSHNNNRR